MPTLHLQTLITPQNSSIRVLNKRFTLIFSKHHTPYLFRIHSFSQWLQLLTLLSPTSNTHFVAKLLLQINFVPLWTTTVLPKEFHFIQDFLASSPIGYTLTNPKRVTFCQSCRFGRRQSVTVMRTTHCSSHLNSTTPNMWSLLTLRRMLFIFPSLVKLLQLS